MAIISFAKTVDEYLSGKKTVTRRKWSFKQRKMWEKFWDDGKLIHIAYDKNPRNGGKPIGKFKLTCKPYLESLGNMPWSDLDAEGGMCVNLTEYFQFINMESWEIVIVVKFEKI